MTTKVNGAPRQGVWFSRDVRFLNVTATDGTFLVDLTKLDGSEADTVNTGLEQAIRAIETRGTVIGLSVVDATHFNVIVDHAQAYDDAAVVVEVVAEIDAISTPNLSAAAIVVAEGFASAALGVPA